MNFKIDFAPNMLAGSNQVVESFDTRCDDVMRKHSRELSAPARTMLVVLMTKLDQLDAMLSDQALADKVLLANTRHTFKYFKAGYTPGEADGRIKECFELHEDIVHNAEQIGRGHHRAIGNALHTFGYRVTPGETRASSVIVGRNFRIIFDMPQ
jgi:hypothetical protein